MTRDPSKDADQGGPSGLVEPEHGPKAGPRRRRILIATVTLGILLAFGLGAALLTMAVTNSDKLEDYSDARADLVSTQEAAAELLEEAGRLEPEVLAELREKLEDIEVLLAEDAPTTISFGIDDRIAGLFDGISGVGGPTKSLEEAIEHRSLYEAQLSETEGNLSEAEELLESTSGEVLDEDAHDQLSEHVEKLKEIRATEPDDTSAESFEALTAELAAAADDASESRDEVSESHDGWVQAEKERKEAERKREEEERKAEEEAAQSDPANYESVSDRDWALVERDPDSYEGEKYRLYGYVTQADAATGNITIRVDTSPTQKYRWYDYDVNTFVLAGQEDVFSDVVQGDHVKMLVEVGGALTYDTAIGGSATAVMVAAYDVEVIGQL